MVINSPNTIFHACKIAFVIANGIAIIVLHVIHNFFSQTSFAHYWFAICQLFFPLCSFLKFCKADPVHSEQRSRNCNNKDYTYLRQHQQQLSLSKVWQFSGSSVAVLGLNLSAASQINFSALFTGGGSSIFPRNFARPARPHWCISFPHLSHRKTRCSAIPFLSVLSWNNCSLPSNFWQLLQTALAEMHSDRTVVDCYLKPCALLLSWSSI